jgi:hypothetical protein
MIALDGLGDGIQAMKGVVGHHEIERKEDGTIGGNVTIGRQKAESLDIRWRIHEVVHAFIKTCMRCSFDKGAG